MEMLSKGQSIVMAAVLMVVVIIAIVTSVFFFARDSITEIGDIGEEDISERTKRSGADIAVYHYDPLEDEIMVTNIGSINLPTDDITVYLNDTLTEASYSEDCGEYLEPAERCAVELN